MRSDIKSKGAKISYVFQVAYGSLCELQLFELVLFKRRSDFLAGV